MTINKYYKEIDYVNELLGKNKLDISIRSDLKVLAKYYKSLDNNEEEVESLIYEFCESKCKGWFNKVVHYKNVDNAVKYAFKEENTIIQIDSIGVTKNEMQFIESLNYETLEKKIIFSMIVMNKLNNERSKIRGLNGDSKYFGGSGEYSYKSLLSTLNEKIARTYREKGIHKTIKKFNDDGYTRTTNLLSLELLFLEEIEPNDEIVLEVEDFDNIGLAYESYYGSKKVKSCDECGKLIKVNSGNKTKCETCQTNVNRESWRKSKSKSRMSKS